MEDTPTGYKLSLFEDLSRFVGDESIKHAVNLDLGDGEVIRCSGLILANTSPHLEVCLIIQIVSFKLQIQKFQIALYLVS